MKSLSPEERVRVPQEADPSPAEFVSHALKILTHVSVLKAEWPPRGTELDMAPDFVVIIFSYLTHVINNMSLAKLILIFSVVVGHFHISRPGLIESTRKARVKYIAALSL